MAGKWGRINTGYFEPKNPEKYKGDHPIVWRSSWERKMMKWCDQNPNVLEWISETLWIPYWNHVRNRMAKYYPDFCIKLKNKHGETKRYLVEVKPSKETIPPTKKRGKRKATLLHEEMTWIINQSKWKSAKEWARKRNMEFIIITEKTLYSYRFKN